MGLLGPLQRTGRLSGQREGGQTGDGSPQTIPEAYPSPPACLEQLEAVARHPLGFQDASLEVLSTPGFLQRGRNRLDRVGHTGCPRGLVTDTWAAPREA